MNAPMIKSVSNPRAIEGEALIYTVELSEVLASRQQVTLDITGGTAVVGSDYQREALEVSYDGGKTYTRLQGDCAHVPSGISSFLVRLPTVDDTLPEAGDETVLLTAGIGSSVATGTGTIVENDHCDPAGVTSVDAASAIEGDALVFKVNLNPPPKEEGKPAEKQLVELKLGDGTAVAGTDFSRAMEVSFDGGKTYAPVIGGKVLAPAQAENFLVRVKTLEDTAIELDETMTLTATSQGQAATGTGTIKDDDGAIIKVADASATEGKTLDFAVSLARSPQPQQVTLKLSAGTASAGSDFKETYQVSFDGGRTFAKVSGDTVTVPANTTKMLVRVDTIDDKLIEQAETLTLDATLNGVSDSALGTIKDNEAAAFVKTVDSATAIEGDALVFKVTMSEAVDFKSQVQLALNGGSATLGRDFSKDMEVSFDGGRSYVAVSGGKVELPAHAKDFLVRVASIEDTAKETLETFTLRATAGGKAASGTGTILDDDGAVINVGNASALEGRALKFSVDTHPSNETQTVELKLHDGTAKLGSDYKGDFAVSFDGGKTFTKLSGSTVDVPPLTTKFIVQVDTIDDKTWEGPTPETLKLEATLCGESDLGTGSITDNEWNNWDNWNNWSNWGNVDPMVIDLNGDGKIQTLARNDGVLFDMNDDGIKDQTGWISGEDAFLVHDDNANGEIDAHREMFGGNQAGQGYEQLSAYDSNRDGSIDARDEGYQRLQIWQDKDADGYTDQGELLRLSDAGIRALSLQHQHAAEREHGNTLGNFSDADTDVGTVKLREAWFDVELGEAIPGHRPPAAHVDDEHGVAPVTKPHLPNLGALFNDVKVAGKDQELAVAFDKKGQDADQDIGSFDDSVHLNHLLHHNPLPGE